MLCESYNLSVESFIFHYEIFNLDEKSFHIKRALNISTNYQFIIVVVFIIKKFLNNMRIIHFQHVSILFPNTSNLKMTMDRVGLDLCQIRNPSCPPKSYTRFVWPISLDLIFTTPPAWTTFYPDPSLPVPVLDTRGYTCSRTSKPQLIWKLAL